MSTGIPMTAVAKFLNVLVRGADGLACLSRTFPDTASGPLIASMLKIAFLPSKTIAVPPVFSR
jgi:hypothetical protein